jgi:calcineurin-like phosphoesterase family protein
MSHRPLLKEDIPEGMVNVFGHIHNQLAYSGICVCVEQTDYKPVLLIELKGGIKENETEQNKTEK